MRSARGQQAFTLIELLIVIVVIGFLLALVGPSFQRMIETQRLRSINSQLVTDLQFARAEAAARNAYVRITLRNDTSQTCYSIYTYTSNATRCDCRLTPACTAGGLVEIKTVRIPSDTKVQVRPAAGLPIEFAFDPIIGALYKIPTDFITPPLTQYQIRAFIDSPRALLTTISLGGRPTVCAPTGSTMSEAAC